MNNIIKTLGRGWTIVFFAALIAVLSMFVVAECPPDCPEQVAEPPFDPLTFNPDDPASFDYVNGDYSTITDWTTVDWSRIPPPRVPEVPSTSLDYSQLDFSQRLEMTVEQIQVNLENIGNLAKDVEPDRAKLAIKQQTGVIVEDFGAVARFESGSLKTDRVDERFVFAGKEGVTIRVDSTGRILMVAPSEVDAAGRISSGSPPKIREESIHPQDKFTIVDGDFITRDGQRHRVSGLSFQGEQTYVEKGDTFSSGDYSIPANKNQINIYLGAPLSPTGNYVAITENSVEIHSLLNGEVEVEAEPGNELFLMVQKNHQGKGYFPSTDTMKMEVSNGDNLRIISRIDEGKTPLFKHHDGGGDTSIATGRLSVGIKHGKIAVKPPEPLPLEGKLEPIPNSAAFELESDAAKLSGTMLRTSSSNRYALLRNGKEIAGSDLGLTVSDRAEVNLMKSVEDLQQKYPAIDFALLNQAEYERLGPEGRKEGEVDESMVIEQISAQMAQTVDQWLQENPVKARQMKVIVFTGENNAHGGAGKEEGRYFSLGEKMIDPATSLLLQKRNDPRRSLDPLGTLDHEFVHVEDDLVKLKEQDLHDAGKISSLQLAQESLRQKYNGITLEMFDALKNDPQFQALMDKASRFKTEPPPPGQTVSEENIEKMFRRMTVSVIQRSDAFTVMNNLITAKSGSNLIKDEEVRNELQQIITQLQIVINQKTGGFPMYAFRNYGDQKNPAFLEVSSTYTEIPPEKVRREIARGNPFVREATQLAYDAGKITEPEYRYRMGGYCQQQACGECLTYTLTCEK